MQDRIDRLLREKQEIDDRIAGAGLTMVSHDRWMADAVEVLLRLALGQEPSHGPTTGPEEPMAR